MPQVWAQERTKWLSAVPQLAMAPQLVAATRPRTMQPQVEVARRMPMWQLVSVLEQAPLPQRRLLLLLELLELELLLVFADL